MRPRQVRQFYGWSSSSSHFLSQRLQSAATNMRPTDLPYYWNILGAPLGMKYVDHSEAKQAANFLDEQISLYHRDGTCVQNIGRRCTSVVGVLALRGPHDDSLCSELRRRMTSNRAIARENVRDHLPRISICTERYTRQIVAGGAADNHADGGRGNTVHPRRPRNRIWRYGTDIWTMPIRNRDVLQCAG